VALLTLTQFLLGVRATAGVGDRPVVFRTEGLLQLAAAGRPHREHGHDGDHQQDYDEDDDLSSGHGGPSFFRRVIPTQWWSPIRFVESLLNSTGSRTAVPFGSGKRTIVENSGS
jgi:hypothetical protein